MNASKFVNPLTISLAGVFATAIAVGLIYFLLIKNTVTDLTAQTATYTSNVQNEGPGPKKAADATVTAATQQVQDVATQWAQIQEKKNPVIDFSNVMLAWNQYINEVNFKLSASIEQWMPSTGIKPLTAITTPSASSDPNSAVAKNPIIIPLNSGGAISVVGTFPQILHHIAAWNNFNRIVVVDKLALEGISPWLTGTYTATVYEFPINGDKPGTAVPSTAGAGGGSATNGGPPGFVPPTGPTGPPAGFVPPTGPSGPPAR
jgi:hypothetical protein